MTSTPPPPNSHHPQLPHLLLDIPGPPFLQLRQSTARDSRSRARRSSPPFLPRECHLHEPCHGSGRHPQVSPWGLLVSSTSSGVTGESRRISVGTQPGVPREVASVVSERDSDISGSG
jgi:hypothetical protein